MRTLLTRVIVPVALAWIAIAAHRSGGDMLPNWLANLSVKTGFGVDRTVRLVTAFAIVGAALGLLSARRAPRDRTLRRRKPMSCWTMPNAGMRPD